MSSAYIPVWLRHRVAEEGRHRCGYCLSQEAILGQIMEMDHLFPRSLGGLTIRENLWPACSACNDRKQNRVRAKDPETGQLVKLFNPRYEAWEEHFEWIDGGIRIRGKTPTGRATVEALDLNRPAVVKARRAWVEAGWHPPAD
jgi:hypothetical protein